MKKRIGAILLTICMLVGLLPTSALAAESCDGNHDLVLKYNETMHWVECNHGGLTCLSDYYGEEISDPSQITDEMLMNGVLDVYYDLHPDEINDYMMWQELLYSEGDAVEHTYNGGTTCVLCHYDKTAGSGTEGDSSDSEGDTGSEGSGSGTGESGSGDSGDSGSGGESGQHKLSAPTNLNWHRFYNYNSNDGSYVDFKSLISWQIADTEYDQTSHVVVYKDGEEVFTNGWTYRAARGEVYQSDWDFSLSDYGSGTYQFTVQACGDGETTEDSVVATSDPWMFTAASTKLSTPETAWSSVDPLTATWTSSTEDLAGGYQIRMYYSPDNANATSTADLDVVSRFVYYTALDGEQTTFGYASEGEDGYYYFQVRAISSDESQVRHSAWSSLSTAYAYGVSSGGDGDTGSGDSGTSGSGDTGSGSTEEVTGYKMTLNYDSDQCSITVKDRTNNSAEVENGGYLTLNSWGEGCGEVVVTVNDGYRIKSVTLTQTRGTSDLTEDFIIGVYGWKPMLYVSSDFTLEVATEAVPSDIPTVTGVQIYSDEARSSLINPGANLTVAEGSTSYVYIEATYSDGEEYPTYTARGFMEYTVDGENWQTTSFGGYYPYFPVKAFQYEDGNDDSSTQYTNYDFRIRLEPDEMYCTGADKVYSEVYHVNGGVPDCNHSWDEGSVTTAATCTADGVMTYTCSLCGETKTETIAAAGHTEVVDAAVAATCTTGGKTEGKHCSVCDVVLTAQEAVAALGHAWSTDNCAEEATCTRNCGETRAAGEHVWGGWTVTTEATCTADGSQTRTCGSCGATESEPIGKLGHNYQSVVTAPTCTDGGHTTHTCSRCGDSYTDSETTALGHDWDDGVITTEPTESADGVKTYTCSVCGGTKTEAVSKLAKQEVSWFPAGPITWTYGQVVSAQNTAYNDTADGGALTYTSSDESVATVDAYGKATIVGAGTAQITATAAAVPGKYAETSASYTLIINKAPLTVTASDASITYGQAPANTGWTAAGFVYDDSAADVTGTAVYTYGYEQFDKVGSYDIHVSGLTSDNYEITYAAGTLTVNKAADYTITLSNLSQRDDAVTDVTASVAPQDTTAEIKVEYLVNDAWTETVPADAGEYQVRASLASSDNIVTDGAYTTGTLTVERSIVVDDTDVSVTVEGEKAEITVTDEELTEIVNNADGEVSIDLSGVTDVTELVLPGDLMDALSESEQADGLTISTGDASITMSAPVLDTVANAVTGEDTVAVKLTTVNDEDLNADQQAALNSITQDAVIVEVSLVITHADGSTTELHQLGGNVEVTVPYAGEVPEGKYIVVCYLSDDGNVTYLRATYDAEKKQVTFNTNHFSNYAVFVSGNPMVVVNGGSGSGLYTEGATVTIKAESKSGYRFNGWEIVAGNVTLADAKKAETTFVMPAEAVELKATYRKNSSSGGGGGGGGSATYAISIEDAKHGEVTADSKTFAKGETVTLTVNPDTGYTLETLTVTDKNGKELEMTKKDGKYTFTMPAGKVTVAATFMEDNSMLNYFADVPADAYYYDAVLWAAEHEITGGTSATTFSPDRTCTRAQAVTFLRRAAGSPAPESESMPFADVPADAYYYDAVLWAVEQGITAGTSETTFSPDMKCTRAQIVTFLWRAQKTPAAETANPFADVANDTYYADAVIWAVEQGITAGTSADTFSPNANCTRAQIVTFLWRCMGE